MPEIFNIFAHVHPFIDFAVVFLGLNVIPIHIATRLYIHWCACPFYDKNFIANFVEVLR